MNLYKQHYNNTVSKDLTSRFVYLNCNQISKLEKLSINLGIKEFNLKKNLTNILLLEFISSNPAILTKAKKNIILLNIKKNSPNGLKLNLKKNHAYNFFQKLGLYVFPNFKTNKIFLKLKKTNSISFSIKEIDSFQELTFFYNFFKNSNCIDINFKINGFFYKTSHELIFFLTSFKFPIFL